MLTPDGHAAEAEHWLKCAASQWEQGNEASAGVLSQMANAHTQLALLASRPTTPDNEMKMLQRTLAAVPSTGEDQAWRRARGVIPAGDEPSEDIIRRARGDDPDPEPSTGEGQAKPRHDGLKTCAATNEQLMAVCRLSPGHQGQHYDGRNGRGWSNVPVPDEGSETNAAVPCECGHYQPDHYRGTGECDGTRVLVKVLPPSTPPARKRRTLMPKREFTYRPCPACRKPRQINVRAEANTYRCPDCHASIRLSWHTLADMTRVPVLTEETG